MGTCKAINLLLKSGSILGNCQEVTDSIWWNIHFLCAIHAFADRRRETGPEMRSQLLTLLCPFFLFILQHLHSGIRENTRTQMKIVESKINIKEECFYFPLVKLLRASERRSSASGNELFCVFSSASRLKIYTSLSLCVCVSRRAVMATRELADSSTLFSRPFLHSTKDTKKCQLKGGLHQV